MVMFTEPMLDIGGCSDGSASSLGRSPFAKQRSFKCMGKTSSKSSSSGAEGGKWDEVSYKSLILIILIKIVLLWTSLWKKKIQT